MYHIMEKENKTHLLIGILVGIILSVIFILILPFLSTFDLEPYYPLLERINYYCEKYTTKNILELAFILPILILVAIFIITERKRKI